MSDKPISPLRQRMIDDITARRSTFVRSPPFRDDRAHRLPQGALAQRSMQGGVREAVRSDALWRGASALPNMECMCADGASRLSCKAIMGLFREDFPR